MKKCMGCMRDYDEKLPACPVCGYSEDQIKLDTENMPESIPPETILYSRYIIGRVLSMTDYSVIYLGWDALLLKRVAIREYFPLTLAVRGEDRVSVRLTQPKAGAGFDAGKAAFIEEGKKLWKNQDLIETVHIFRIVVENGTAYQIMEYLEGITLQDYLEENGDAAGQENASVIFSGIVQAVNQIHQRGIIHGNLSPENIYVDDEFHALLIDFGLAKQEILKVTRGQVNLFDPRYTAPEVLEGKAADAAADLYSLGAIQYRLLSAKEPPLSLAKGKKKLVFDKKGAVGAGQKENIRLLMSKDPARRKTVILPLAVPDETVTDPRKPLM